MSNSTEFPPTNDRAADEAEARTPSVVKPTAEGERKAAQRKGSATSEPSEAQREIDEYGDPITERRRVNAQGTDTDEGPVKNEVKGSFAGRTWVALSVGIVLLVLLLIFIIQNMQEVSLKIFAWSFSFPAGVGFLMAAIAGAIIMVSVGAVRMFQLRKQIKSGPEAE